MRSVIPPLLPVSTRQARINSRFRFRIALFQRRGMDAASAGEVAYQLEGRDADSDDRRMCLECESFQRSGNCFQAAKGNIPNATKDHRPVRNMLMRCDGFSFATP